MNWSFKWKIGALIGLFLCTVMGLTFIPPIPQWDGYHNFADSRPWLGIPNFGDVMSNAGFVVVGLFGLVKIFRDSLFDSSSDRVPYFIFFVGVTLVGLGSGYYHWVPSKERLFWDRLPMAIAFMSFFAAVIADRIHRQAGIFWLLPILLFAGVYSLLYWQQTEVAGAGDLRFYGMVQFFPMVAIPVIFWLFRDYRYTEGKSLLFVIGWYVCSKILEHFDPQVFELLRGTVSGHSLKHLAAAVATFLILRMLKNAQNS